MKIFKTIIAAALLLIGTAVMAQAPGNRQSRSATERAKLETERMVTSLELNADQTAKIQVINMKYAIKDSVDHAIQPAGEVNRDARMKARQAVRDAKALEIKPILTDAQKVKFDAQEKERQTRGGRNRPAGQGGQPQGGQQ